MALLVTYNMQGGNNWNNVGPFLTGVQMPNPANPYQPMHQVADIVCLQECGTPPQAESRVTRTAANSNGNLATIDYRGATMFWLEWGAVNNRCSLAIITRANINNYRVVPMVGNGDLRQLLGIEIRMWPHDLIWFYTTHMPSGNHGFASACAFDVIANSGQIGAYWAIAGDWNCSPTEFMSPPNGRAWASRTAPDIRPVHSGRPTHQGGNNLDYVVSNRVPFNYVATQMMSSDHAAVWFSF
jgi:hypothetical protein